MTLLVALSHHQNPGKPGQEIQNSTAELIKGLVQLVPLNHSAELSQEAMEVRLFGTVNQKQTLTQIKLYMFVFFKYYVYHSFYN